MLENDGFLTIYILIVSGIFGAVFGSFINCMAWRIAHNESITKGRSHCAFCGHPLGATDLIPVFSYIFLKGKCRYCGERISPRYMLTELVMAIAFAAGVYFEGLSFDALTAAVLACILMGLSLVDLETFEIPHRFIAAGLIWWIISLFFAEDVTGELKIGLTGGLAFGGGMLLLSILFDKVTGKESLGGGDIKLFFMMGLFLGPAVGLFNLILSCIFGIGTALMMKNKQIPFGPAISLASFVSVLLGEQVVDWYLGLFYL